MARHEQKDWCCHRRRSSEEEEAEFDFEEEVVMSLRAAQFVNLRAAEEFVQAQNGRAWEVVQGQCCRDEGGFWPGEEGEWGKG